MRLTAAAPAEPQRPTSSASRRAGYRPGEHNARMRLTRARELDVLTGRGQPAARPGGLAGRAACARGCLPPSVGPGPNLTLTGKAPDIARSDPPYCTPTAA